MSGKNSQLNKEKILHSVLAEIYGKSEPFVFVTTKEERNWRVVLFLYLKLQKLQPQSVMEA